MQNDDSASTYVSYLTRKKQRTRQEIVTGLVTLLETYPFDQVTIAMICHQSMIHHTTFYRHFEDKYDVLSAVLSGLFVNFDQPGVNRQTVIKQLSDQLTKHWVVFENITRFTRSRDIYFELIKQFSQIFEKMAKDNPDSTDPIVRLIVQSSHSDYAVYGLAGSIIGTFVKWNEQAENVTPSGLVTLLNDLMTDLERQLD